MTKSRPQKSASKSTNINHQLANCWANVSRWALINVSELGNVNKMQTLGQGNNFGGVSQVTTFETCFWEKAMCCTWCVVYHSKTFRNLLLIRTHFLEGRNTRRDNLNYPFLGRKPKVIFQNTMYTPIHMPAQPPLPIFPCHSLIVMGVIWNHLGVIGYPCLYQEYHLLFKNATATHNFTQTRMHTRSHSEGGRALVNVCVFVGVKLFCGFSIFICFVRVQSKSKSLAMQLFLFLTAKKDKFIQSE